MGRSEWSRNAADKRARNEATQEDQKRRRLNGEEEQLPIYTTKFSKDEIDAEGRKPKKKVAVMLGYSGSGYKGMQLNHHEKTIEGDLFGAFVAAGAISKANADDPKKSSLVRCARTDRGVHAAGNIISLKMIIEDPDIVKKINDNLSPQIRVWGIERTNGAFSAYQLCDSRVYEYLIPTYSFLPPPPESFLGKELVRLAGEADDLSGYEERQSEVCDFWKETEERYIQPYLDSLDADLSASVRKKLYELEPEVIQIEQSTKADDTITRPAPSEEQPPLDFPDPDKAVSASAMDQEPSGNNPDANEQSPSATLQIAEEPSPISKDGHASDEPAPMSALETALRKLKNIITSAKKAYRIHPTRLTRVQSVLKQYVGTHNFHNHTISKAPRDPSAKRVIKSFNVGSEPVLINNTEWLSLKVHGQSFMMHQIRKMVTLAALIVRCGCAESRVQDTYRHEKVIVPKAPSLGLLLERPVFDTFNSKMRTKGGEDRQEIGFEKYREEIGEFKQREIYERIFREEEKNDTFHAFFAGLDGATTPDLLYLSSVGLTAAKKNGAAGKGENVERLAAGVSEDEEVGGDGQEG
ncbi:MAG: hypothetical protein LQ352_003479 [Teloschistes flavicans]|nr:MAG: hypothetical protein LQ352_003479 [Teloschistes flavicans]